MDMVGKILAKGCVDMFYEDFDLGNNSAVKISFTMFMDPNGVTMVEGKAPLHYLEKFCKNK